MLTCVAVWTEPPLAQQVWGCKNCKKYELSDIFIDIPYKDRKPIYNMYLDGGDGILCFSYSVVCSIVTSSMDEH